MRRMLIFWRTNQPQVLMVGWRRDAESVCSRDPKTETKRERESEREREERQQPRRVESVKTEVK
jgi:hypothetical protein